MFNNSGMAQFKDFFRERNVQNASPIRKSARVSGKHNDLKKWVLTPTTTHHVWNAGNWSFKIGFKKEAIAVLGSTQPRVFNV
jgi:alanyl-tRNA synthetase